MTTVYLPIEISKRELVAKTMLAGSLAAAGHRVLIFRSDLFDRAGWPEPGIYVGKNVFRSAPPCDLRFFHRMKNSGIRVWHLDEEGGIYLGNDEMAWRDFLARRYDPGLLGPEDKVLAWGEWQAEYFSERALSAPVHITGHMNFDVCRPCYAEPLAEFDVEETNGLREYILINTRFATSNAPVSGDEHVINSSVVRGFFDQDLMFDKLVTDGHLFYDFIQMVFALARRFPKRQIVLRPHPAEDSKTYRRIFAPLQNVLVTGDGDVGSWIRLASCVIHNGCTTAVQAAIAGKPVITYMPRPDDSRTTACLPNQVGTIAPDLNTVGALVEKSQECTDDGNWRRTISRLDTIEKLTSMVNCENDELPGGSRLGRVQFACRQFRASEAARSLARLALPAQRTQFKHRMRFFDPNFFGRVPHLTKAAQRMFSTELRCSRLDAACFAIQPR